MDGVTHGTRSDRLRMTEESLAAATAVTSFLASGYGPHGGHRLLDLGDDVQLLKSAASGLNQQELGAVLTPFQDAARSVAQAVGDGATTAAQIAAGLVQRALETEQDGLSRANILSGFLLAKRQALATVRSLSSAHTAADALAHVSGLEPETVQCVVDGIQSMATDQEGHVDLDDIDIRVEPIVQAEWSEGVFVDPQHGLDAAKASDVGVAVVDRGWSVTPRSDGITRRIVTPDMLQAAVAEEQRTRDHVLDRLLDLGIGLVVCGGEVDDGLCDEAARRGIWVWTDAPKDARRRILQSTGATARPDLDDMDADGAGRADLRRRPRRQGGGWVIGPGPSATLVLPAGLPVHQASVSDDGERLLRAAGAFLQEPQGVPGGGRWQRMVAKALRDASVHATGKQALAVRTAAQVMDDLADRLVHNAGSDPLDVPLLPDADGIIDPTVCVRAAVDTGFDAAIGMLRIDGRFAKRPSTPAGLRGGTGPSGSPKGMPGDIPPLM